MPPAPTTDFAYLPQDGEMVNMLRAMDWAATPLGAPAAWPESLHLQLNVCFDSPFAIAVWWGPALIQFYNDGYRPILGATKHPAAFGRPARETWPDIWPTIGPMVDQVMQQGIAVKGDDMPLMLDRNGYLELCNFTFSYSPIRDRDGVIHGMFTAAVETTARVAGERRQAFQLQLADRLRGLSSVDELIGAANELARTQLDVTRAFYAEIDADAGTFFIPPQWNQDAALPELPVRGSIAEFGTRLLDLLSAGEPVIVEDFTSDPHFATHAHAYASLGIASMVIVPLVRHGQLRANFNFAHAVPRRWSAQEVTLLSDAADRAWEAIERARAEQALLSSNRMKDEFLAMLAHELRNPLAPISAAADLLALARLDPDKVHSTSAIIRRQVAHMTGLVDDLLDVSRVTRGLVTLAREHLDVHDIVGAAVEQARPLMQARHHELLLGEGPGRATVHGDRKRLIQVLVNLLNNAAKYTPPWGRVALHVAVLGDWITITVTDNGMGMDADLASRAFELFAQGERNADRTQGGLGIGLALVKHLVELHGGSVTARSEGPGRGSEFAVTLPVGAMDVPMAMILEAAGHDVTVEHTAQAALRQAARRPFDTCLLDIGLPDINGNELARRLRALPGMAHALLVAVTGYGQPADRHNSAQAGFDHHFVKPVDTAALTALLAARPPN
jgi:signal transduction histidine kinase/CheY-like chemotaxis protein